MNTVIFDGKTLTLTQDAFAENYKDRICYFAMAEDDDGNEWRVRWETTAAWDNNPNDQDDESNACDWANPDDATMV